jgi:hypothetical protein
MEEVLGVEPLSTSRRRTLDEGGVLQIGPRAKRAAGAADDHDAEVVILVESSRRLSELLYHRGVDRVEPRGPI